jgi:hypothetical protein
VSLDTVKKVLALLDYCLGQKDVIIEVSIIFYHFYLELVVDWVGGWVRVGFDLGNKIATWKNNKNSQPCQKKKMPILRVPGPIVTLRLFKQVASIRLRTTTLSEYEQAAWDLETKGCGKVINLRTTRSSTQTMFLSVQICSKCNWKLKI